MKDTKKVTTPKTEVEVNEVQMTATKEVKPSNTKVKASKEELLARAREALNVAGPCHIDPKYLESGFQYQWVLDEPGRIPTMQKLGYEIVLDENLQFGDNKPNSSSRLGSAVTLNWKSSTPLVLMRVDQDMYDAIQAIKAEKVKETEASIHEIKGIDAANTYGSVDISQR